MFGAARFENYVGIERFHNLVQPKKRRDHEHERYVPRRLSRQPCRRLPRDAFRPMLSTPRFLLAILLRRSSSERAFQAVMRGPLGKTKKVNEHGIEDIRWRSCRFYPYRVPNAWHFVGVGPSQSIAVKSAHARLSRPIEGRLRRQPRFHAEVDRAVIFPSQHGTRGIMPRQDDRTASLGQEKRPAMRGERRVPGWRCALIP